MPRIIAGRFGGRTIVAPAGRGTRPTSDRVREGLFNRLVHLTDLDGDRVLDLYAGSGALGLEALSRGAGEVVLVDSGRKAVQAAETNVATLAVAGQVSVRHSTAAAYLSGAASKFDLVFLDPPYEENETALAGVLSALAGWLSQWAFVVVERSARSPEPTWPEHLSLFGHAQYGETRLWFAEFESSLSGV